jgi:uncharacterized membrane protein
MDRRTSRSRLLPGLPDLPADDSATGLVALDTAGMTPSRVFFAATMIGVGILGLMHGDFALVWQRIPIENLPGRQYFAYVSAAIELMTGIGLLLKPTATLAARVLCVFLLLWLVLLKLPAVVMVPQMEATWLGFGEIAVMLAGAWILFAADAGRWVREHLTFAVGANGVRWARLLFAVSLPMIGLSHFVYSKETVAFVPGWLPFPLAWAYLTGAGSIAASLALLFGVWPRLAATLEAAMLGVITLLVWGPGLLAPFDRTRWTGFVISAAIACGAWIVADSYRGLRWLATGSYRR